MKNIHLLSTKSKTRLYLSNYGKELNLASHPTTFFTTGQHIYITSDEEIKEGDWCLDLMNNTIYVATKVVVHNLKSLEYEEYLKKIILTTNQDLINDGIQAIDDEFLEWFVKNPSCEEIKVEVVDDNIQWYKIIMSNKVFTPIYNHVEFINDNIDEFDEKIKEFKHEFKVLTTKEVMEGRSSAYNFIDFGKIETLEDIKLEEVVGSKHCRYSVIENKLSALYRNQEQILKAIKMLNHRR
jgi:hypothetical protein